MPAVAGSAKQSGADRHKGKRRTVALDDELYALLMLAAKKNNRPALWQAKQYIEEGLSREGFTRRRDDLCGQ